MDNRLALLTGADIPIPECQLTLKQPTIKAISLVGEREFFEGVKLLTIDKSMLPKDKIDLSQLNNFQIFIAVLNDDQSKELKEKVESLLFLLFPNGKAKITARSIMVFNEDGEIKMIDEGSFDTFQQIIKLIFCMLDKKEEDTIEYNIDENNQRAKAIRDKLMKGRAKAAQIKGEDNASIFSNYISVVSVALGISLLELNNYTMYQLLDTIERYSLFTKYDLDIRARVAGATSDKPIENWTKNIHNYI